jgi:hypothetical protein
MMHGQGESDGPVVPAKSPNNAAQVAAEVMEGRGPACQLPTSAMPGNDARDRCDHQRRGRRQDPGPKQVAWRQAKWRPASVEVLRTIGIRVDSCWHDARSCARPCLGPQQRAARESASNTSGGSPRPPRCTSLCARTSSRSCSTRASTTASRFRSTWRGSSEVCCAVVIPGRVSHASNADDVGMNSS